MLYRPSLSVTTLRTFSMRAGLAASTVTPGSTAPDVSLTTPAIPLADACCADAIDGSSRVQDHATPKPRWVRTIGSSCLVAFELPMLCVRAVGNMRDENTGTDSTQRAFHQAECYPVAEPLNPQSVSRAAAKPAAIGKRDETRLMSRFLRVRSARTARSLFTPNFRTGISPLSRSRKVSEYLQSALVHS